MPHTPSEPGQFTTNEVDESPVIAPRKLHAKWTSEEGDGILSRDLTIVSALVRSRTFVLHGIGNNPVVIDEGKPTVIEALMEIEGKMLVSKYTKQRFTFGEARAMIFAKLDGQEYDAHKHGPSPIRTSIPVDAPYHHQNYLGALEMCWNKHYDVVLTPDHIWYTLLCEITGLIKASPEEYRSLFSDSPKKQELVLVGYDDAELIDLERLKELIHGVTPSDTKVFLPVFSTSTDSSRMAFYAAFADAMSPYYNYSMMLCRAPYVRLEGTDADWNTLVDHLRALGDTLGVQQWAKSVIIDIRALLADCMGIPIFALKRCGSGHQEEVTGWFARLFMKMPSVAYASNFPTHLSEVVYKNLTTQRNFKLHCGILHSTIEPDGKAIRPQFGFNLFESAPPTD